MLGNVDGLDYILQVVIMRDLDYIIKKLMLKNY